MKQVRFQFVAFEYMTEVTIGEFIPLEVGVVEWSMAGGILREYHSFIDPGKRSCQVSKIKPRPKRIFLLFFFFFRSYSAWSQISQSKPLYVNA